MQYSWQRSWSDGLHRVAVCSSIDGHTQISSSNPKARTKRPDDDDEKRTPLLVMVQFRVPALSDPTTTLEEITAVLSSTIRQDEANKLILFCAGLLTFTEQDQINILMAGESSGAEPALIETFQIMRLVPSLQKTQISDKSSTQRRKREWRTADKSRVVFKVEGGRDDSFCDYWLTNDEILRIKTMSVSELQSKALIGVITFPVRPRDIPKDIGDLESSRRREAAQLPVEELLGRGIADRIPWSRVLAAEIRPAIRIGPYKMGKLLTIRWNVSDRKSKKATFSILKHTLKPFDVEGLQYFLKSKIGERLKVKD